MTLTPTQPSNIYLGSTECACAYMGSTLVRGTPPTPPPVPGEYIEYVMTADSSGNLYVPHYTHRGFCNWDWNIYIDGNFISHIQGTSSGDETFSGYEYGTAYTIKIIPENEIYGRAKNFKPGGNTSYNNPYTRIGRIIYDGSYMGYADSSTNTGDYFRAGQYLGCRGLIAAPEEYLPNTVTNIGRSFRSEQYRSCSSLQVPPSEYIPNTVTSIGDYFRSSQYIYCKGFSTPPQESLPNSVTSIGNNFRSFQYSETNITSSPNEVLSNSITTIGNYFRASEFSECPYLVTAGSEAMPNSVTTIGNYFRSHQYYECTALTTPAQEVMPNTTTVGEFFRDGQYLGCSSLTTASVEATPSNIALGFRFSQYDRCTSLLYPAIEVVPANNSSSFNYALFRNNQYARCTSLLRASDEVMPSGSFPNLNGRDGQYIDCTSLIDGGVECEVDTGIFDNSEYRREKFRGCTSLRTATLYPGRVTGSYAEWRLNQFYNAGDNLVITFLGTIVDQPYGVAGIDSNNVSEIRVPNDLLASYQSDSAWSSVASLFTGYTPS